MTVRITVRLRRRSAWSRKRRLLFLLLFALALSLGARTVFGERGLLEGWRLRAEADRLEAEVAALRASMGEEQRAVRELLDGDLAIERIARERLGMARKGEVIYLLPVQAPADAADATDEAEP